MFEFLFKYSPFVYQEGTWAFRSLPALPWLVLAILLIAGFTALIYRKQISPISPFLRALLASLKIIALLLLLGCFLEPFLSVRTLVPKKSSVLLLVDDSASMSIQDSQSGSSRRDRVSEWLGGAESAGLLQGLQSNFNILPYRFSEDIRHLNAPDELQAAGKATNLYKAMEFAASQAQNYPVSAVILVTDGIQALKSNGSQRNQGETDLDPLQAAAALQSAGLPVFTIGVGSEIQNDVQLAKVNVKRSVVENDVVEMSALVHAKNANSEKVTVQLLEEGRVVQSKDVELQKKYTRVFMSFKPTRRGYLKYTAVIQPIKNELITSNNEKSFLVNNEDRLGRILYIEELHPSEFKFIKRALDLDKSLQLVSMVRTGKDKFYRQGISNPTELAKGFPDNAESLFAYQAIIIGSIEANFFSTKQQELIRDFVSKRGGGLLMLGGPKSFSDGGWEQSKIADVLPVQLLPANKMAYSDTKMRYVPYKLQLTPEGLRSPILQLAEDVVENRQKWESMPELRSYSPVGKARPGATVLAVHPANQPGQERIVIAEQRFGRGRSMVLATSTTWRWQMRLPSTDMRHEKFWRQTGRWLALSAPPPVEIALDKETYMPGEKIPISISVLDSNFAPVKNAQISAEITLPITDGKQAKQIGTDGDPPVGRIQTLDFVPDLAKDGRYKGIIRPGKEGLYEIEILAHDPKGKYLGRAEGAFLVQNENLEYRQPDLQEPLLKRIAEITGGRYMHIDHADHLAEQLTVAKSSYAKIVERDIWDAPAIYLLIVALLAIEWYTRRSKGLS